MNPSDPIQENADFSMQNRSHETIHTTGVEASTQSTKMHFSNQSHTKVWKIHIPGVNLSDPNHDSACYLLDPQTEPSLKLNWENQN